MVMRWLVFSLLGFSVVACSSDDGEACSPTNEVDDTEVASAAQALSPADQRAIARAVASLSGAPRELAARTWSEARGSSEGALVRDFVESAWIDRDPEVASRLVADAAIAVDRDAIASDRGASYVALRRVVVSGDLVLALSEGVRDGQPRQLQDLFRVAGGRVVQRWSGQAPSAQD